MENTVQSIRHAAEGPKMKHAAKYRLQSAIEKLLQHKKLDDITVSEIIQTANVCRKTFYRNYQDKYALAASYFANFFDHSFGRILSGECFDNALFMYLDICEEKASVLKNAYSSADVNGLRKIDIDYTRKTYQTFLVAKGADIQDPAIQFAIEIAVRGGTDMVIDWIMHDMPISKVQLKDWIKRTLPNDLLSLIQ
jgi:AcrR family transcriptional regulator